MDVNSNILGTKTGADLKELDSLLHGEWMFRALRVGGTILCRRIEGVISI